MANTTAPAKSTAPVIAEATAPVEEAFAIDNKELTRIITVIRYRLNEQIRDANRKTPILSKSQDEARAKATSLVKVLKEFSEQTF